MSKRCAQTLGIYNRISYDFTDPCLHSISGHETRVIGKLHKVTFRLKGSSVTFRKDFWVCDAIDDIVDVMIGARFIKNQFRMLFEGLRKCANTFATWFSKKKETPQEKLEREERKRQQDLDRRQQENERIQREEQLRQSQGAHSVTTPTGIAGSSASGPNPPP